MKTLFGVFERFSGIESLVAESLLDTEQLVVLANTVGAACRAGLDKAGVHSHGEVGNGGVLDHGHFVETYNHHKLMAQNGLYKKLVDMQSIK